MHASEEVMKRLRLRIESEDPQFLGLKKLKIRGKDLSHLPPEVYMLTELEVLDLSPDRESNLSYRLHKLQPGIGRLIHLKWLMLDTNDLYDIPPDICMLTSLERLSLSNNHLEHLPDAFSSMKNLRSLHLANNAIEDFPRQLCQLENLEFLDLSDNRLLTIPEDIAKLKNLENLLLFINKLAHLPDTICTMTQLRLLWLGRNQLRALPRDFGNLMRLDWGHRHTSSCVIDENPLKTPPIEVCKKGIPAIKVFMDKLKEREAREGK